MQLNRFSNYLQDYSAPIGFRIAAKHPDWIEALIIQNDNAYEEGLKDVFWIPIKAYWQNRSKQNEAAIRKSLTIDATKWQYTHVLETSRQLVQIIGLSISLCLTVQEMTRSSSRCSIVTKQIRRFIHNGKNTCEKINPLPL